MSYYKNEGKYKMKRLTAFILTIVMVFAIVSCSDNVNCYSATMLIKSSSNNKCSAEWGTLKGSLGLNTKLTDKSESSIHYTATLEEGEISVYYETKLTEKELLFTVKGGETAEGYAGYAENGQHIDIVIEAKEQSKGGKVTIDFDTSGNV